jgi:signal transduction histidine kinase
MVVIQHSDNQINSSTIIRPHPRKIGWIITAALALGGSNLSLFMISGLISGQDSAGVLLLISGVIISWLAIPAWTELMLLFPNRVGGIAANTAVALKPYNPILANLNGVAYWSCTVPGVSLSAIFIATAIQQWFLPSLPVNLFGIGLVLMFTLLNVAGIQLIGRIAVPFALIAMALAFLSAFIPVFYGQVDWVRALSVKLNSPFTGLFGGFTSLMAGLYLIAFSAPAFEQGLCYVGEMKEPIKNVPRLIKAAIFITAVYYILLPVLWYLALGTAPLTKDLTTSLAPTFAPLFHESAKFMSASFMIFNSVVCLISSLSCCSRTMAQLSEDGLVPEGLAKRAKSDAPWAAVVLTAAASIVLVYVGSPNWLIAATNFEYIINITLATLIVLVLRRTEPGLERPYRASRFGLTLGLIGVVMWLFALAFGFQQFGLLSILAGIAFPFSGLILYFWRIIQDRRKRGVSLVDLRSLQVKLTGTMVIVLALDSIGYLIAVYNLPQQQSALITALEDIFVVVALLTISIGLLIPGMVANAAIEVSNAARKLVKGTLSDFAQAMQALGRGEIEKARANIDITPIKISSHDEIGRMGESFNELQYTVAKAAVGLDGAREGLSKARKDLLDLNAHLEERIVERTEQLRQANQELQVTLENLKLAQNQLVESGKMAALGILVAGVAHEVNTPIGICIAAVSQLKSDLDNISKVFTSKIIEKKEMGEFISSGNEGMQLVEKNLKRASELIRSFKQVSVDTSIEQCREINLKEYLGEIIFSLKPIMRNSKAEVVIQCPDNLVCFTYPSAIFQAITVLVINSIEHAFKPGTHGKISIEVQLSDNMVNIHYCDNGAGIPAENIPRIFEPFFTTRRGSHNVGLGLSIAYNLITHMLQGNITCKSNVGNGVDFHINFPMTITPR